MTNQDIIDRLERIESLLLQLTSKKENTAPFLPFMEQAVEEAAVSEGNTGESPQHAPPPP